MHFGLDRQRALWFLGSMAKTFKSWDVDQVVLLPPSVQELVPAGHLAHFVRDLVRESLDVSAILTPYTEDRGFPPYDPTMMTALLLYAYSQGLYASRRIAKACEEQVDFMAVTARQSPDFRTISDFRKRHLVALGGLFTQVLQLCQKAGLCRASGDCGPRADEPSQRYASTRADAGGHQSEYGPTGAGALGGCRVLLRAQSHRIGAPPRSRLCRDGSATAWHGLGRRQTEDCPADASPRDEGPPDTRWLSQSLSVTKPGG